MSVHSHPPTHIACSPASLFVGEWSGYDSYRQTVTRVICEVLHAARHEHAFRALVKDFSSVVEQYGSSRSSVWKFPAGSCPLICPAMITGNQFVRTSLNIWNPKSRLHLTLSARRKGSCLQSRKAEVFVDL